jgi:hypothetical protein
MLAAFFAEHGQTPASTGTIERARYFLSEEEDNVTVNKDSWYNESFFTAAFRPLLLFVISCVHDIIKHKKLDVPIPIKLNPEEGPLAIPDFVCSTKTSYATFLFYHLLIEMKTVSDLNGDVVDSILEQAGPGGEWSAGNFRPQELSASEKGTLPVQKRAASMIRQVWQHFLLMRGCRY